MSSNSEEKWWVPWMRHVLPSYNTVIPRVVEDNEMPGGRALITPAKKEAIGKEEGGIWLFSDFHTPLLHYLTLKHSYSDGIFLFLIQVWPLRFSSLSGSCHICFLSIYYTYSFFFFLPPPIFASVFIVTDWILQDVFFPSSTSTLCELSESQGTRSSHYCSAPRLSTLSHSISVFSVLLAAPPN